jgi:hypothetical protein
MDKEYCSVTVLRVLFFNEKALIGEQALKISFGEQTHSLMERR